MGLCLQLRFEESQIQYWAKRYMDGLREDDELYARESRLVTIGPDVRKVGYLNRDQLVDVVCWVTTRVYPRDLAEGNDPDFVKDITSSAFMANDERNSIKVLTELRGVGRPIGSAVLHLFHKDLYPFLSQRSLWSVRADASKSQSLGFWMDYVSFCRDVACRNNVSMRTLDRALWRYSLEHQNTR